MNKLLIFFACTFGLLWGARAQEHMTLEKAIRIGLDNNYAIKIAENQRQIAENTHNPGEAGLLPSVDASAGRNWSIQDVEQNRWNEPEPIVRDNAKRSTANSSIAASYVVNVGALLTFRRLGHLSELSEHEAKITIENTLADITTAYYRLVLEQQRYEVLQNTLSSSEERLRISKDKYELGKASKQEYLAAQVDYNTDFTAIINQEEVIANARIQLNELLGRDPQQDMIVKDTILVNEDIELEALYNAANLNNPQLLAAQREINIAHLQLRELQAQHLPQLELFGSYGRQTTLSEVGFALRDRSRGYNYGLTARLNLFNGLVLRNRIQNARILEKNETLEFSRLKLELEADISEVYNAYRNSLRLLKVARTNYEVAMENADISLERYRLGHTSALEFREAQQNALAAEARLIDALFTIKAAEVELKRLAGTVMAAY